MPQEIEKHDDGKQRTDDAGFDEFGNGTLHAFCGVADNDELDARQIRIFLDFLDFDMDGIGNIDQIGILLAQDIDTDRRTAVKTAVRNPDAEA
jgi:hypothetical protein